MIDDVYLVATCTDNNNILENKNDDVIILGSYRTLEEAKDAISFSHVRLVIADPTRSVTIYKVPLDEYKFFTFTRNDLTEEIKEVKLQDIRLEQNMLDHFDNETLHSSIHTQENQ